MREEGSPIAVIGAMVALVAVVDRDARGRGVME